MVQTEKLFAIGDKVLHTGRPEWGSGLISKATRTTQDGKPCQMLTIRFDRAGLKTISTAFANLIPADSSNILNLESESITSPFAASAEPSDLNASRSPTTRGTASPSAHTPATKDDEFALRLKGFAVGTDIRDRMTKLPEPATDPFCTPQERLKATFNLYRFSPTGGSLLDWAAMQSGLADPLSRFNRHELENFYHAFTIVRDAHLKKLIAEARKQDPITVTVLVKQAPPSAQQALRRLDALR